MGQLVPLHRDGQHEFEARDDNESMEDYVHRVARANKFGVGGHDRTLGGDDNGGGGGDGRGGGDGGGGGGSGGGSGGGGGFGWGDEDDEFGGGRDAIGGGRDSGAEHLCAAGVLDYC
jgi:hypothetical protein